METGTWDERPLLGPKIANCTRVVSDDRAGIRGGAPPTTGRDLNSFLGELGAVLQAAAISFPVVLVGHSLGGLIAYQYGRRFPDRVCGPVLLDSSHPQQAIRFAARASAAQLVAERGEWAEMLDSHPERPDLRETLARTDAALIGDPAPSSLDRLPLAVVSRGVWTSLEKARTFAPDLIDSQHSGRIRVWNELQAEYVSASDRARHVRASRSGHDVYLADPELALGAVRAV